VRRVKARVAFGRTLAEQARSARTSPSRGLRIDQARLLTLRAAIFMDTLGNKKAARKSR